MHSPLVDVNVDLLELAFIEIVLQVHVHHVFIFHLGSGGRRKSQTTSTSMAFGRRAEQVEITYQIGRYGDKVDWFVDVAALNNSIRERT